MQRLTLNVIHLQPKNSSFSKDLTCENIVLKFKPIPIVADNSLLQFLTYHLESCPYEHLVAVWAT